ncbi:MAG: right-handed parallel beta-helix repeat-containing protein [Flavitalea sp.]
MYNRLIISVTICFFSFSCFGQQIFVSTSGNDNNNGSESKPVATFQKAQQLARTYPGDKSVEVIFGDGIYYLARPVILDQKDSRSENATIVYRAANEGKAILSGGSKLNLKWISAVNGIFTATIPGNIEIDQLYINGKRQRMARYPNAVEGKNVYDTWDLDHEAKSDSTKDVLSTEHLKNWKNPSGGFLHAMHEYLWGDMHWIIKGRNPDGTLITEGGWQNNRPSKMHPLYRMVENIFEELDAEGEWFYDRSKQLLYYKPQTDTDLSNATIEVVRLKNLIEIKGTEAVPVSNISLKGFTFKHVARTFMLNKEPLLRSDWTVYRGGALFITGAKNIAIEDCEFDQVGGNAVFVNNVNRNINITGCYIHEAGANGIAFVGSPEAVRSPLFRYGPQDYSKLDKAVGPKSHNYPSDCFVDNCLITATGRDEKQTAGIQISMSAFIRISNCSVYDVPRAGINISEGTFGGHTIEESDIFNTVLETGDHGSFNSWGRDRYWTPDVKKTSDVVLKDPGLPSLDMIGPNIIRHNRWRCDHGWDIDLDDGSSNYQIYDNLLLNGGLKLREGYNRQVTNNIIINNGLHPHVWYQNSGDVFTGNIVFKEYQPAIMDQVIGADGKWGQTIDRNYFITSAASMKKFLANGCDSNSIQIDLQFINAVAGDFRLKDESEAIKKGFANFPMNDFGVKKASLKAIAKTPVIPALKLPVSSNEMVLTEPSKYMWMGVLLGEPKGDALSAFGVKFDAGGVALLNVGSTSLAYKNGFRNGDLLGKINDQVIKSINDLKTYTNGGHTGPFIVIVTRNQSPVSIQVEQLTPVK